MPEITYEEINPSPIENTEVFKVFSNGVIRTNRIKAKNGYVLHDKNLDTYMEYDEKGNGVGDVILGFYAGTRSVKHDYDFGENPRDFYAVLEREMPNGAEKL